MYVLHHIREFKTVYARFINRSYAAESLPVTGVASDKSDVAGAARVADSSGIVKICTGVASVTNPVEASIGVDKTSVSTVSETDADAVAVVSVLCVSFIDVSSMCLLCLLGSSSLKCLYQLRNIDIMLEKRVSRTVWTMSIHD